MIIEGGCYYCEEYVLLSPLVVVLLNCCCCLVMVLFFPVFDGVLESGPENGNLGVERADFLLLEP